MVKDNKEALKWATESCSSFKWQKGWTLMSMFGLLSGVGALFIPNLSQNAFSGILLGSVTLYGTGLFLSLSYMVDHKYYLDKAINTYNGVYEKTPKSTAYRFNEELRGDIMLGMVRF